MKRPPDNRTKDNLPSFLDESTVEPEADLAEAQETEAEEPSELDPPTGLIEDADVEPEVHAEEHETPRAQPEVETRAPSSDFAGVLMMLLGVALVVGSAVLIATQRDLAGFSPQSLMVLGAVLFATSVTHRRLVTQHRRREATESLSSLDNEALLQITLSLQSLAEAHRQGGLPLAADDLQQVSRALQRQDEKINNLTKAMKMYGKPLMEITGQGAELYSSMAVVKTAVESAGEVANKALARIEQQLRADTQKSAISPELLASLTKATAKIASLEEKSERALEPLQKQIARLETTFDTALEKIENNDSSKRLQRIESSVAAAMEKIENNDSDKRLQRIEEATKKAREDVQELRRGPDVEKVVAQLQDRLDKATTRLADGIQKMREDSIAELASQIREIQREIVGLSKSMAQVQNAVKNGAVRAEASAPAWLGPAPAAPQPTARASSSAPPAAPAAGAPGVTPTATGEYQTGKRATSGKNVLGAIAKLKQMKG
jgi:predicted DNA-binding transcriptional regulator